MDVADLVRVVVLRRGRVKPTEFRLRGGEKGLSLFELADDRSASLILEAVRETGKQGDIALAVLDRRDLLALGLVLVKTPGGTRSEEVNRLHCEARFPWWRRWWLALRFQAPVGYFNDRISPRIGANARLRGG